MHILSDSGLTFEILEVLDDSLVVCGTGDPFTIQPAHPESTPVLVHKDDSYGMTEALKSVGFTKFYEDVEDYVGHMVCGIES